MNNRFTVWLQAKFANNYLLQRSVVWTIFICGILPIIPVGILIHGVQVPAEEMPLEQKIFGFAIFFSACALSLIIIGNLNDFVDFCFMKSRHAYNYRKAISGKVPYFLFLRSFSQPELYQRIKSKREYTPDPYGGPFTVTFDEDNVIDQISDSLSEQGPIISIGGDCTYCNRFHNVLRLEPVERESWRDLLYALIPNSRLILVVPGLSSGILEEVSLVKELMLNDRTVFLMIPEYWNISKSTEGEYESNFVRSDIWKQVQHTLQSCGICLPEYCQNGGIFTLTQDGELDHWISLDGKTLESCLLELMGSTTERHGTLRELQPQLESIIHSPLAECYLPNAFGDSQVPGYTGNSLMLLWPIGSVGISILLWTIYCFV